MPSLRFEPLSLSGAWLVHPERREDNRGFFARTYCQREFHERGLHTMFPQCNISWNRRRGTLRGMHFQREPQGEVKLIRCSRGAVYDVIVDLRPGSSSYRQWVAVDLNAENRASLYAPAGFAHGFQALEDDTEVVYQMGASFVPELAGGVRWNDPAFGIEWPIPSPIVSARDGAYPDFLP